MPGGSSTYTSARRWAPWLVGAALLAASLSLGWIAQSRLTQLNTDTAAAALVARIETSGDLVDLWVEEQMITAQFWAAHPSVVDATRTLLPLAGSPSELIASDAQALVREQLAPMLSAGRYRGFFIIAPGGTSLGSTRDANTGTPNLLLGHGSTLERALGGQTLISWPQVSDVPLEPGTAELPATMFVVAPIEFDGEVIAAFSLRIDPERLSDLLASGRPGETGETFLFDREGNLLSASRFEDLLRAEGIIDQGQSSILTVSLATPLAVGTPWHASLDDPGAVQLSTDGYASYHGGDVVGAWQWDPTLGVGIAVEQSHEEVFAVIASSTRTLVFGGITIFMLIAGALVLEIRRRNARETMLEEIQTSDALRDELARSMQGASQIHQALSVKDEQLSSVMRSVDEAIVTLSPGLVVIEANASAHRTLGYEDGQLVGLPLEALIPPEYRSTHETHVKAFAKASEKFRAMQDRTDLSALRSDGTVIPVSIAITKVKVGGNLQFVATLRDLLPIRRAEAALGAIGTVFHELRTPITAVAGIAEVIGEGGDDLSSSELRELLGIISAESTDLVYLLEDLLTANRLDRGTLDVPITPLDSAAEVAQVLQALSVRPTVSPAATPAWVFANAIRLRQIIRNLLTNADRYGGDQVMVLTRPGEETTEIIVADNGDGVPAESVEQIFQPYSSAHGEGRPTESVGLGLAASRALARAMEGDLTYRRTDGLTEFVVTLRTAPAEEFSA